MEILRQGKQYNLWNLMLMKWVCRGVSNWGNFSSLSQQAKLALNIEGLQQHYPQKIFLMQSGITWFACHLCSTLVKGILLSFLLKSFSQVVLWMFQFCSLGLFTFQYNRAMLHLSFTALPLKLWMKEGNISLYQK